jgi:hypothetical protein
MIAGSERILILGAEARSMGRQRKTPQPDGPSRFRTWRPGGGGGSENVDEYATRFDASEELRPRTIDATGAALEVAGVAFVPENGAGVRLKKFVVM